MTTTVLIAYKLSNSGAEIVGEYAFTPANDGHDARSIADQAIAAAARHLEVEHDVRTARVVLFGSKSANHNAEKLAASRAALIEHFAA